jgi:MFS family permease
MILGLPGLLVSALIVFTVPEPQRRGGHKPKGYPLREVIGFIVAHRAMHLPLLTGILINSIQTFGTVAWMPAFYERTYGWGPAVIGPLLGSVNMVSALLGLFGGAWLAEWLGKRRDDANVRVLFLANFISIPFIVIQPLMPSAWLAIGFGALGGAIGAMGGAGYNSALQLSTPNAMRGQINALYLFMIAAIGGALGPLFIALLTDYVAGAEEDLRYVLVGFRLVLAPIDALLIWLAIRPYGKAFRDRIVAGD